MRRAIINSSAMWAICLCFMSCSQENEGTESPATQSDNSIAPDVEAGNQDQQESDGDLSATWIATKASINATLVDLVSQTNDDASVGIEDLMSGKGFQFIRMPNQPITLFLPLRGLNAEEAERAEQYFAELGVRAIYNGGFPTYLVNFDQDHERAANVAIDVFMKIYQLPSNFDIQVDLN